MFVFSSGGRPHDPELKLQAGPRPAGSLLPDFVQDLDAGHSDAPLRLRGLDRARLQGHRHRLSRGRHSADLPRRHSFDRKILKNECQNENFLS